MRNEQGIGIASAIWSIAGLLVILAASVSVYNNLVGSKVKFETPYQCVVLTNGSVYFGKLEGYGTKYPVLKDVYYVVSQTNPDTKEVKNVLVKRGKELHSPDRMLINPNQILLVEPVGTNSEVAKRIAESKTGR